MYGNVRKYLDNLYAVCGGIAALSIILLLILVLFQITSRLMGMIVPGLTAISGYIMCSAFFFALGSTALHGGHIKVSLLLNGLGQYKHFVSIIALGISVIISIFFSVSAISSTYQSYIIDEISQSPDAIPLWIPQLSMVIGTVVFTISVIDLFIMNFRGRPSEEEQDILSQEGMI